MAISVEFTRKGQKIEGRFYRAGGDDLKPTILLLRGFPGGEGESRLGQAMVQNGINTMIFQYRGTGKSEGKMGWGNVMEDIDAAIGFLKLEETIQKYRIDRERLILGGQSFGGGIACAYAARNPEIKVIFSIAGDDYGEFAREYERNPAYASMIDAGFKELEYPTGPIRYDGQEAIKELIQDPKPYDQRENAAYLADREILLIGGWDDKNVTIEHKILPFYRVLKEAKAERVQIVAFQDDHYFGESRHKIIQLLVSWVKSG
jgi:pimeloyl-ACP methyl ester carboxylesterase